MAYRAVAVAPMRAPPMLYLRNLQPLLLLPPEGAWSAIAPALWPAFPLALGVELELVVEVEEVAEAIVAEEGANGSLGVPETTSELSKRR